MDDEALANSSLVEVHMVDGNSDAPPYNRLSLHDIASPHNRATVALRKEGATFLWSSHIMEASVERDGEEEMGG